MFNPYSQFKRLYPKTIQLETIVVIFHMFRKTFFNEGRNMGDTSVSGGTILLVFCILLNLWIIVRNKKVLRISIKKTKWFFAYIILCGFSFMWAITGSRGFTSVLLKDIEIATSYLVLSVIMIKIRDLNKCAIYIVYIMTISALCGGIAQGFLHTNSYSFSAMLGFIVSLGLWKTYKIENMIYFICINALLLIVGTSSASYIATLCALFVLFSSNNKGINLFKAIIGSLFVYLIYEYGYDTIAPYIFYGHSQEAIEGGTGRYEIWGQFIDGWKKSPILGYGYVVGERNLSLMGGDEFIFSAHNGYISVLVNTGIIGSFIFLIFILKTIYRCLKYSQSINVKRHVAAICFAAFCGLLVNNMSYPALGSDWNYTFPPLMCLIIFMNTFGYKKPEICMQHILTKHANKYSIIRN